MWPYYDAGIRSSDRPQRSNLRTRTRSISRRLGWPVQPGVDKAVPHIRGDGDVWPGSHSSSSTGGGGHDGQNATGAEVLHAVVELRGAFGIDQQIILAEHGNVVAVASEGASGLALVPDTR